MTFPESSFFHQGALVLAALIMLAAALSDARRLVISNRLCLCLVALFPLYVMTAPHEIDWLQNVAVAGAVLLVGFAMFALNLLGGGDVKMLAATALWAGPKLIATLLVYTSFAGGILAMVFAGAALVRAFWKKNEQSPGCPDVVPWHKTPVPYGLAIACGGVSALYILAQAS